MNKDITYISVDNLVPHPDNPRLDVGDVTELAESIKAKGILQNLTVVPFGGVGDGRYRVIIGHRRLAASKQVGIKELPCFIADMDEQEQIETMLLENMQRSDLTYYEQAKGFQMMFTMNGDIKAISEKTGFSETTVRRRLKLLKLDKEKFQAAELRGGKLDDYIKAAEIKDEKQRNEVIDAIGTGNFQWKFSNAMDKQILDDTLPAVKKEMKKIGAKKDDKIYSFDGTHEKVYGVLAPNYVEGCFEECVKKNTKYWWNVRGNEICLYRLKPKTKTKPVKKTPKEIEANKQREKLKSVTEVAYNCRREFVSNFSASKKNDDVITEWLWDYIYRRLAYYNTRTEWDLLCEKIGEDNERYKYSCKDENLMRYVNENPKNAPAVILFALSGDSKTNSYYIAENGENMPRHTENSNLDRVYEYLCKLGYEMSDEEKALQNGTHELFAKLDEAEQDMADELNEVQEIE